MVLNAAIISASLILGLGTPAAISTSLPAQGQQQVSPVPPPPSPNPDAAGKHHIGDGVLPPTLIYTVDPEFTEEARQKKLGGVCIVSMIVDTEGHPQNVQIVKSIANDVAPKLRPIARGLDIKAVEAAKKYRYKPATFQGKPVPAEVKVEIAFRIY